MYSVKEMFYTLQGEGTNAGRAAVFLRFAGCNLWNGQEKSRAAAICNFCDTDFVGTNGENGGKFRDAESLAMKVKNVWSQGSKESPLDIHTRRIPLVVCTGGEPALQLDKELVMRLHFQGFEVAIETNGTIYVGDRDIDFICVSPKGVAEIKQTCGSELKLVYPQPEIDPRQFEHLLFGRFYLSPKNDGAEFNDHNTQLAVNYCLRHPQWRLNTQMHKLVGVK